jgi:hypothetical protein
VRAFENRVLRKIFGSKRDEIIRGWRKSHNDDLHNMYARRVRRAGLVARRRKKNNA